MTKQTEGLFKPEVYKAMQEKLNGSSTYRGAEEAFEMFYSDRALQDFLRAYAIKEDVRELNELKFMQAGKDRKIHLAGPVNATYGFYLDNYPQLFIGPRQKGDSALIVYARDEDLYHTNNPSPASFQLGEIRRAKEGWRIFVPEQIAQDGVGYKGRANYPVSQAPLFQKVIDKQDILEGLERVVKRLLKKE